MPVLPANETEPPSTERFVAVPSCVTFTIMSVSSFAASGLITCRTSCGSSSWVTRPSGSVTCCRNVGRIILPSSAIVAATIAICSGVVSSRSWPIATRPMSTWLGSVISLPVSVS